MDNLDVALVATRRPEVLEMTLRSFHANLFRNFKTTRVFVNIDPLWGNERDDDRVEQLCRMYFSTVEIHRPDRPSFGAAVKWVWEQSTSNWFLHLEDDWLLARKISPENLERNLRDPGVGQVKLKNSRRSQRIIRPLRSRFIRRGDRREKFPLPLTTSPGFVHRVFAIEALKYMDPNLDPERQFSLGYNPAGTSALSIFHPRVYGNIFTPSLLYDIGRTWRKGKGKTKRLVEGKSVWEDASDPASPDLFTREKVKFEQILARSSSLPAV